MDAMRPPALANTDAQVVMVDNTIVSAHQHSAGYPAGQDAEALGRSRGGFSTKIHVLLSAASIVQAYEITGGHTADVTSAPALLKEVYGSIVLGDKGYDSDALIGAIECRQNQAVIPPRRNRKIARPYDATLYRQRNIIERYFARVKQFRRFATRYDKTSKSFVGFFCIANCYLMA
jgi:transposase